MDTSYQRKPRIDLNPSSADRWTTCTASPKFIFDNWDKLPEQDYVFAAEGTTAHEVAAALLQGRKINPENCPVPPTKEMHWHAWEYMEFVEGLREQEGRIIVEQKLPLFYAEGRNAIVDAAVINPNSLHIVDYKYGEGIIVDPTNNLQATIYAKSVAWSGKTFIPPDDFPVTITIYQPRAREGSAYNIWETTWGVVENRALLLRVIAENILSSRDEGIFLPSEKACQWCPAKGFCAARKSAITEELAMLEKIDDSPKPMPNVLTIEQLAAIVEHGDHVKKWIDDAQAFALQHACAGNKIPGYKVAMSRGGNRKWSNPILAGKLLVKDSLLKRGEVYEESVISPAAAEKLIGKGNFPKPVFNLITKTPGWPILVRDDDPRPSALVEATTKFQDLDA